MFWQFSRNPVLSKNGIISEQSL